MNTKDDDSRNQFHDQSDGQIRESRSALKFERDLHVGVGDILTALRVHRLSIALLVALSLLASLSIVLTSSPIYKAEALLAPATTTSRQGIIDAISPLSGLAQFAGIDLSSSNSTWINLATVESRAFIEAFIKDLNLMPVLFSDEWDFESKDWKSRVQDDPPTIWEAYKLFDEEVLDVSWDTTTQLISVAVYWKDPKVAAEWVNAIVDRVNEALRQRAIVEAQSSIEFLHQELDKTSIVGLRQSIYDLTESQISTIMLAKVREDYAFRVIDPAVAPDRDDYVWPKPVLIIAIGGFIGLALGLALALLRIKWSRDAE